MRTRSEPDPLVALRYGLAVFPMPPGHKRPGPGWRGSIITSPAQLPQWPVGANVGVACRASGVVGLDLDHNDHGFDGVAAFAAQCANRGQSWPDTLTVTTPHGGQHLYFRAPAQGIILSTSSGRSELGAGIDVRAPGRRSGGYLAGPSSIVDDTVYAVSRETTVADLPSWLAWLLCI